MDKSIAVKKIEALNNLEKKLTKILFYTVASLVVSIGIMIGGAILWDSILENIALVSILVSTFTWLTIISYAACVITLSAIIIVKIVALVYAIAAKQWRISAKYSAEILLSIFVLLILLLPVCSTIFPYEGTRTKARDARRMSDMRQLLTAQDEYFKGNGNYFPSQTMPAGIGNILVNVPIDPMNTKLATCPLSKNQYGYCTLDNTNDQQRFCYYAKLESRYAGTNKNYLFYTASPAGNFMRTTAPETFDECAQSD